LLSKVYLNGGRAKLTGKMLSRITVKLQPYDVKILRISE